MNVPSLPPPLVEFPLVEFPPPLVSTIERHSCGVCGKSFRASSLLDIHMRVHVGAKPFVCPQCGHRATQKGNLKLHMRKHHGLDLPRAIDATPDSGIWGTLPPGEVSSSMLPPGVVEVIRRCQNGVGQSNVGRTTESLTDFLAMAGKPPKSNHSMAPKQCLHSRELNHTRAPDRKAFNHEMAPEKFNHTRASDKDIFHHQRAPNKDIFNHTRSPENFPHQRSPNKFHRVADKESFMASLGLRGSPFTNPAMRNLAEIGRHSGGFRCQHCPKWFKYRSVLGIHARSHTGERPFVCPHCEYAATQQNCLKLHLLRHHRGGSPPKFAPARCPICSRVSPSPGYLKIHMRSHKRTLDHVCPVCGRGFKEYWYLSTHLRTHDTADVRLADRVKEEVSDWKAQSDTTWTQTDSDNLTAQAGEKTLQSDSRKHKRKMIQPRSRPLTSKLRGQEVARFLQGQRSQGRRKSTPRKISMGNYLKQNDDEGFRAVLKFEFSPNRIFKTTDEPLDLTLKLATLSPHEEPLDLVIK